MERIWSCRCHSTKLLSIDAFNNIDPMLDGDAGKSNDSSHLLSTCDITVDEFECFGKIRPNKECDENDSEWDGDP